MFASPISSLSPELFWLAAVAALTGISWLPYVLDRIVTHGLWAALKNPTPEIMAPRAGWAGRARAAHLNAIENLVVFAPLTLAVVAADRASALTAAAAGTYFYARLAHALIYIVGVPVLRTLAYAVGLGAAIVMALALFGLM